MSFVGGDQSKKLEKCMPHEWISYQAILEVVITKKSIYKKNGHKCFRTNLAI